MALDKEKTTANENKRVEIDEQQEKDVAGGIINIFNLTSEGPGNENDLTVEPPETTIKCGI